MPKKNNKNQKTKGKPQSPSIKIPATPVSSIKSASAVPNGKKNILASSHENLESPYHTPLTSPSTPTPDLPSVNSLAQKLLDPSDIQQQNPLHLLPEPETETEQDIDQDQQKISKEEQKVDGVSEPESKSKKSLNEGNVDEEEKADSLSRYPQQPQEALNLHMLNHGETLPELAQEQNQHQNNDSTDEKDLPALPDPDSEQDVPDRMEEQLLRSPSSFNGELVQQALGHLAQSYENADASTDAQTHTGAIRTEQENFTEPEVQTQSPQLRPGIAVGADAQTGFTDAEIHSAMTEKQSQVRSEALEDADAENTNMEVEPYTAVEVEPIDEAEVEFGIGVRSAAEAGEADPDVGVNASSEASAETEAQIRATQSDDPEEEAENEEVRLEADIIAGLKAEAGLDAEEVGIGKEAELLADAVKAAGVEPQIAAGVEVVAEAEAGANVGAEAFPETEAPLEVTQSDNPEKTDLEEVKAEAGHQADIEAEVRSEAETEGAGTEKEAELFGDAVEDADIGFELVVDAGTDEEEVDPEVEVEDQMEKAGAEMVGESDTETRVLSHIELQAEARTEDDILEMEKSGSPSNAIGEANVGSQVEAETQSQTVEEEEEAEYEGRNFNGPDEYPQPGPEEKKGDEDSGQEWASTAESETWAEDEINDDVQVEEMKVEAGNLLNVDEEVDAQSEIKVEAEAGEGVGKSQTSIEAQAEVEVVDQLDVEAKITGDTAKDEVGDGTAVPTEITEVNSPTQAEIRTEAEKEQTIYAKEEAVHEGSSQQEEHSLPPLTEGMQEQSPTLSLTADDIASKDILAIASVLANMKSALVTMSDAFGRLGNQTEKMVSLSVDIKAADQIRQLQAALQNQITRQKIEIETLRALLKSKIKEAVEEKIRSRLFDLVKDTIQQRIEEQVRDQLSIQIPQDLKKQVISHKRQILQIKTSLHNSEARHHNSLQTTPGPNARLRPLLRPLPTPEQSPIILISRSSSLGNSTLATPTTAFPQVPAPTPIKRVASSSLRSALPPETVPPTPSVHFPRDLSALFALSQDETKRLLREYGLDSAASSPARENVKSKGLPSVTEENTDSIHDDKYDPDEGSDAHAKDMNKLMAHFGVPFLMIPGPKEKLDKSAPLSSRSRRKLLTPLIIK